MNVEKKSNIVYLLDGINQDIKLYLEGNEDKRIWAIRNLKEVIKELEMAE